MALTAKTYDDLFYFHDTYWLNLVDLADKIYEKWDSYTLFDRIKAVHKMNSLCSRYALSFYEWNLDNGWFLAESVRFFKGIDELKKPEASRHSKRYNMTYGERLGECFDDFQAHIGWIITTDPKCYLGNQIKLLLKMKVVSNETIAVFDDIYTRWDWYDDGLLKHGERKGDGGKGSFLVVHKNKKPAFKP